VDDLSNFSAASMIPRLLELNALLWPDTPDRTWETWLDLELTMPQFKLLLLVASGKGFRVGDLANKLGVTPPTVTTILDRLVEQGLVRREDDPTDRRLVIARLTSQGRDLLQQLRVSTTIDLADCVQAMSPRDLWCLLVGMEALHRATNARQAALVGANDPEPC
jgi:DNA-binding MarR family transcriptional regulator